MTKKTGFFAIILTGLLLFSSCAGSMGIKQYEKIGIDFGNKDSILRLEKNPALFRLWLKWRPIDYLMIKEEKKLAKEILKMQGGPDRVIYTEAFIKWFWARRDNNKYDDINEFKEDFYNRVVEAQTRFANKENAQYYRRCTRGRGWETDMGLIYILLGEKDYREPYTINELVSLGGGYYQESTLRPKAVEIWYYYDIPEEYEGVEFLGGVAYIIFEKNHAWEFVNEWAYYLTQGYRYYDLFDLGRSYSYSSYQGEVYTKFIQAVAKSYIYDWDLELIEYLQ